MQHRGPFRDPSIAALGIPIVPMPNTQSSKRYLRIIHYNAFVISENWHAHEETTSNIAIEIKGYQT